MNRLRSEADKMSNDIKRNMNENNETTICGTLVRGIGSFYTARDQNGREYTLRCKKKFRREKVSPLVGDKVLFIPGQGEEHGWIEEILPRKTVCLRPPVANVTLLAVVIAPVPEPDLLLVDRQISRAFSQGINVILIVNKCDIDSTLADKIRQDYQNTGITILAASAKNKTGLEEIRKAMGDGSLCCFTGQSGAGKSTMLNALLDLDLETGDISRKISRGKNTTRHTELIEKNGIRVMDTAGFNLLEAENDLEPDKLKERYPEFIQYEGFCRFRECLHDKEPDCAVKKAMLDGKISEGRLNRYQILLEEAREVWRERYD